MRTKVVGLLVVAGILGAAYVVWARGANERAEKNARPLFVPVIISQSVQLANGQVLLYKATNVSEGVANFRLMLFNDREGVPGTFKDFRKITPGHTVSYVYEPPKAQLTIGSTTVEAPEAVRAVFAPIPGDKPAAMRRIVAGVQILRVQSTAGGTPALDPPTIVPVQHCNFEPRGFMPFTGLQWHWNCAPDMFPLDERWRPVGQGPPAY